MPRTEEAIMASVTQTSKSMLMLEVLTRMHGRTRLNVVLKGGPIPPLYPGCTLTLTQEEAGLGEIPTAQLHDAIGGLENSETNRNGTAVLNALRMMMSMFLPMYDPAADIYEATRRLIPVLRDEDARWPIPYLAWELALLSQLGHDGGLERCRTAFSQGETIYISPRSGKSASRAEAGAFLDRMIPVPGFFLGKRTATIPDVRQGEEMTTMLFQKFAMPEAGVENLPPERQAVARAIQGLSGTEVYETGADENFDEESYRRRLLSLRKLKVAERCAIA